MINKSGEVEEDSQSIRKTIQYVENPRNYQFSPPQRFFHVEKVVDWEDRIKDYSRDVQNLYYIAFQKRK